MMYEHKDGKEGKPLNELLSRSMVDIYVGPQNTHWILHEKLLCSRSAFFSKIFWDSAANRFSKKRGAHLPPSGGNKSFGLPEEYDEPFRLFVGWLYSGHVPSPEVESDLGDMFDLYLMGEKWAIADLVKDVLDAVRKWYHVSDSFPGLRRVQYIYANTDASSPMRQLLVGSVARMLVLGDGIPSHWDKALRKNGQLAVDIMLAIQQWRINADEIPDAREEMLPAEEEKMKVVEQLEKEQTGVPRQLGENAKKGEDQIKLMTNGHHEEDEKLTNGVNHENGGDSREKHEVNGGAEESVEE